jgi:hypothetical protein
MLAIIGGTGCATRPACTSNATIGVVTDCDCWMEGPARPDDVLTAEQLAWLAVLRQ